MSGHYTLLPLGVRVRAKIASVIKEEMDRIGAQEFLCPAMHPAELWQQTGRWGVMGDEMFRLQDRKGADLALGMTHEEVFTTLALELHSYRDLPQMWYQIQTKFRDEPRPKAGLLRTREFTMKDSYSFDLDEAGLDQSFDLHHDAYSRIFTRLDVPFVPVEASSGAMGGSDSVEFMSPCEAGEDDIVTCTSCGYAANVERATSPVSEPAEGAPSPVREKFSTPGVRTIQELANDPYGVAADRQIKTLIYVLDGQLTLVLLRGDHELVEPKLADGAGAVDLRSAHPEEIKEALGALPGSLGAVAVTGLPIVLDTALQGERDMVTGANEDDFHLRHVDVDRDILDGTWMDVRGVTDQDPCPNCHSPLRLQRALEIGHIFKLGRRYAEALGTRVQDQNGDERTIIMGSYGIGVERVLAAVIETHHDDQGIIWPLNVAPFEIAVVPLGKDDEILTAAENLYQQLLATGVEAIIDDRPDHPGAKLNDVELVGIPYRLVIGRKSLRDGEAELTTRATGETQRLPLEESATQAAKMIAEGRGQRSRS